MIAAAGLTVRKKKRNKFYNLKNRAFKLCFLNGARNILI